MCPALNWSRVLALSWGFTETSPVPSAFAVRPCCLSQKRSATSWVLPFCGLARVLPFSCAAEVMSGFTTSSAPPVVAPATIFNASPWDCTYADSAADGPT